MLIETIHTLKQSNFSFEGVKSIYHGKVRDVYSFNNFLVMVASDRISAFDYILPKAIPYKGQVLNQLSAYFLNATKDIVPNWVIGVPDPNVTVGKKCVPYKVEFVIRGHLSGHAWREYQEGKRFLCGVKLPEGMKENDRFPQPIITPATKAAKGHDQDISKEEIIAGGVVSESDYEKIEHYTQQLFSRGQKMAGERGLILGDTKYEFGKDRYGEITLIDEIHTPDSSRYFYKEGFEERQRSGARQKQLSKEFVREWLMSKGFSGRSGEKMPEMGDDFTASISERYIELFEKVTGEKFIKSDTHDLGKRIEHNIKRYISEYQYSIAEL